MHIFEQRQKEILDDVSKWVDSVLHEEIIFQGHLRWIILKRCINGGINPTTMKPLPEYTREQLQTIVKQMEKETSRDLERIHAKYLW